MAVTSGWYGRAFLAAFNGEIDFNSDTIKAALTTASHTIDNDAHDYFNDLTNEVTGTGYTAGGATLTTCTVTIDTATNTIKLDCDDPAWATATITARALHIYKSTGTGSTSPLIAWVDFGTNVSSTGATFTYQVPAAGLATITYA